MSKNFSPSSATRWAGILGAGVLSIAPLFAASATLATVIENEKIGVVGPQTVLVSWTTWLPAGSHVVYGPVSHPTLSSQNAAPLYGYSSITPPVSTLTMTHEIAVGPLLGTQTIYFRPVSTVDGSTVVGDEMNISLSTLSGSCAYVTEYLKKDGQNDPKEVKNLQAFLRGVEKDESVHVTGIFDDATYEAVRRFQAKYAEDILEPWGVTESTGYVYITTKRKINEIFCSTNIAFTKDEEVIIEASKGGGGFPTEIGSGVISNDGTLVWGNGEENATGTGAISEDNEGDVIGSTGNVKEKLSAVVGGTKNFFSQNQMLVLLLFIAAFSIVYLSRGNHKVENKIETKLLKGK